jgi:hypothetical protein
MGWCFTRIGNYSMELHDSIYDYIRENQPKGYYEKKKIEINFCIGEKIEKLQFPLTKLGKILIVPKYVKGQVKRYYNFKFNISLLQPLLYDELVKRDINLIGHGEVNVHLGDSKWKSYYLYTEPCGVGDIKLSDCYKPLFKITSYKEFTWFAENGILFVQHK